MSGLLYVFDQLGAALQLANERIAELVAAKADLETRLADAEIDRTPEGQP